MDLAWVKAMQMQNMWNVTLILDTPAYTYNFAKVLGTKGDGIYANSEYEPFLGTAPALADWRSLMQQSSDMRTALAVPRRLEANAGPPPHLNGG